MTKAFPNDVLLGGTAPSEAPDLSGVPDAAPLSAGPAFAQAAAQVAPDRPEVPHRAPSSASASRAPTPVDVAVGCRIGELRRRAGLTQREVSHRVGVTPAQFFRYERGLARISTGRLMRICEALNIPLEAFMELGGPRRETHASAETEFQALLAAYRNIPNEAQRLALLTIARSMAQNGYSKPDDRP
jgi:transcriptional regulator with XRE-family HTH domain